MASGIDPESIDNSCEDGIENTNEKEQQEGETPLVRRPCEHVRCSIAHSSHVSEIEVFSVDYQACADPVIRYAGDRVVGPTLDVEQRRFEVSDHTVGLVWL